MSPRYLGNPTELRGSCPRLIRERLLLVHADETPGPAVMTVPFFATSSTKLVELKESKLLLRRVTQLGTCLI
jgi:hypothetical protein